MFYTIPTVWGNQSFSFSTQTNQTRWWVIRCPNLGWRRRSTQNHVAVVAALTRLQYLHQCWQMALSTKTRLHTLSSWIKGKIKLFTTIIFNFYGLQRSETDSHCSRTQMILRRAARFCRCFIHVSEMLLTSIVQTFFANKVLMQIHETRMFYKLGTKAVTGQQSTGVRREMIVWCALTKHPHPNKPISQLAATLLQTVTLPDVDFSITSFRHIQALPSPALPRKGVPFLKEDRRNPSMFTGTRWLPSIYKAHL